MKVSATSLAGVLLVEPQVHGDARGFFLETWVEARYAELGIGPRFVQDNLSRSAHGIVRGLHLQHPNGQGKLVSCLDGEILDVAVDVRAGSPSFGRHLAVVLSGDTQHQIWIPPGFAHGFAVRSETAIVTYKCTAPYARESEIGIAWNDPDLGIEWGVERPILSERDLAHPRLRELDERRLPRFAGP